ncbi:MAG: cytidine deaminase [Christensenellaceae bacterium]|jgi:cytidine deaminase|nr:cytidine deaminase [Christensenellaceae bacterium]
MLELNNDIIEQLIQTAKKYADNSYCPYSALPIGASILCGDDTIFGGCNIECCDYSAPSLSAGDTVIAKAISEGYNRLLAICIYNDKNLIYPNAGTRQMLYEFNSNIDIITANKNTFEIKKLNEIYLMPIQTCEE